MAATNRNKQLAADKAKAAAKGNLRSLKSAVALTVTSDQLVAGVITPGDHSHYFKDVQHLETLDVYRVLKLLNVADPCIQHAVKKLLVAGGRGAGKDITQDIEEAIDSLDRWLEMANEDAGA